MDQALLSYYLDQGLSLPQIGVLVGRDPSTVGYWVKKHGLVANGHASHAPRGGLTRDQLSPLVERGLSLRQIGDELGVSASTVRHWLSRYGLRTKRRRRTFGDSPKPSLLSDTCRRHGLTDFVLQRNGAYRCKRCRAENVIAWRRRLKRTLVEEAGGRCALCGYDRHLAALHFHHRDPTAKGFSPSQGGGTRALAKVRDEVRKCILLCANCHAEVEGGFTELPLK